MTPLAMCLLTASLTFLYYLMVPLPRSPTLQCSDSFSFKDILELLHPVDEIGVKGIIEGGDEKFCLKAVVTDDHPFQGRVFLNFVSIRLQDSLPGLDPEECVLPWSQQFSCFYLHSTLGNGRVSIYIICHIPLRQNYVIRPPKSKMDPAVVSLSIRSSLSTSPSSMASSPSLSNNPVLSVIEKDGVEEGVSSKEEKGIVNVNSDG